MDKLESLLDRLEKVTQYLEAKANSDMNRFPASRTQFASKGDVKSNPSLKDFDDLIAGPLQEFMNLSGKIGGDVKEQSVLLKNCFNSQRKLLELAAEHSKPSESQLADLIKTCGGPINAVVQFKDQKRSSPLFNHISAVAESVLALGWINVSPTPAPYVKSMQDAAQFFTNRVIKDYKDTNPEHVAWTKALMSVWTHLHDYVRQHHTTGLAWNASGSPTPASGLTSSTMAGSVVPPPPPPLPDFVPTKQPESSDDPNGRGALFAQLNRGENVTAGLRKVTDDMKTHKNPELRAAPGLKPHASANKAPIKPPKPGSAPSADRQSQAVLELRGNKWVVENFQNQHLHVTETEPKQTVYIYKCVGCTVEIKGKINSIMVDNCKKTGVVFDDVISSLDVVNCQSVQTQCLGKLQTVNVDKTDGCQIYLSAASKFADVITAKSSEINMLIPKEDGEFDEFAVPEQFKTKFTGKGLHTTHNEAI
ncbi:Cyclase associated actin cytoskeleton regulatory protein 1 [Paragonimus heterotremus]|uniref:Cyclase associated actin cytoskeleton regulatory protein 1 n=1 Tax=Paragonimus heterotremus TaxID=100268 RepID=A0A8J4TEC7_9TREM|nr:Cyclase associated actin cytoskeleton regulatory protein 1 [Paragonimus heterotremus]